MSLVSITSVHLVTILEPNVQVGTSAGAHFNYRPADPPVQYRCRVAPVMGQERIMLLQLGYEGPHRIHFSFRPVGIDLRKWLRWEEPMGNGTILRVKSLPLDYSGLGRHYVCVADVYTADNEDLADVQ